MKNLTATQEVVLLEARIEVLRTKLYRGKYEHIESACAVCGNGEFKTVGRIVLDCKRLNPVILEEESDLVRALGFAMGDGSVDLSRVTRTKQKLVEWWEKSREG